MSLKNKYLYTSLTLVILAGCKTQVPLLPGVTPYKIDIQQGNAVTQEMVAKLQPGMTRNQVRFVLGTPLLVDPFRGDRWDYFYSYMKGGTVIEERKLAVFFKDDKLVRVEGDVIAAKPPAEKPVPVAPAKVAADKPKPEVVAPKPTATVPKPDTAEAKPAAAKPEIAKPQPVDPAAAQAPATATLTTGDGVPVGSSVSAAPEKPSLPPATQPDVKSDTKVEAKPAAKSAAAKPETKAEEKPKEERGFFGRMLDRIGL